MEKKWGRSSSKHKLLDIDWDWRSVEIHTLASSATPRLYICRRGVAVGRKCLQQSGCYSHISTINGIFVRVKDQYKESSIQSIKNASAKFIQHAFPSSCFCCSQSPLSGYGTCFLGACFNFYLTFADIQKTLRWLQKKRNSLFYREFCKTHCIRDRHGTRGAWRDEYSLFHCFLTFPLSTLQHTVIQHAEQTHIILSQQRCLFQCRFNCQNVSFILHLHMPLLYTLPLVNQVYVSCFFPGAEHGIWGWMSLFLNPQLCKAGCVEGRYVATLRV